MKNNKEESDKESKSEEEMKLESKEEKKEYKNKNLINKTYFYWKFQEILNKPETCRICLKVSHNKELYIFKKNLKLKTFYISEKKINDFNLDLLCGDQEENMEYLLKKYKYVFIDELD
ncbi:11327_t:CDS:1 [Gigaspora margarita]|uniref:11327_t:CDS:1 n=1 Tax=Gigaspora margarita TaxID=4874 RepID=A0ABN7UZG4_GIGMA|nr:11327_t:CDS:1 [Gigaspora margarita]